MRKKKESLEKVSDSLEHLRLREETELKREQLETETNLKTTKRPRRPFDFPVEDAEELLRTVFKTEPSFGEKLGKLLETLESILQNQENAAGKQE